MCHSSVFCWLCICSSLGGWHPNADIPLRSSGWGTRCAAGTTGVSSGHSYSWQWACLIVKSNDRSNHEGSLFFNTKPLLQLTYSETMTISTSSVTCLCNYFLISRSSLPLFFLASNSFLNLTLKSWVFSLALNSVLNLSLKSLGSGIFTLWMRYYMPLICYKLLWWNVTL